MTVAAELDVSAPIVVADVPATRTPPALDSVAAPSVTAAAPATRTVPALVEVAAPSVMAASPSIATMPADDDVSAPSVIDAVPVRPVLSPRPNTSMLLSRPTSARSSDVAMVYLRALSR